MHRAILALAGVFEIGWAVGLKYTDGFTRGWPSLLTFLAMLISVALLGVATKSLPVGVLSAVWVGIGVVGTALTGMLLFDEPASTTRMLSLLLIGLGVAGLKLSAGRKARVR